MSSFTPKGGIGCSFIYRLTFAVTSLPWSRKADCLGRSISNARSSFFLKIASISFGRMLFLRLHFLIRSLYCFGLIISWSLIYTRGGVAPYVASSLCRSLINSITLFRVPFSYSLVISDLWASQSFAVYFRASFCTSAGVNVACHCGWCSIYTCWVFEGAGKGCRAVNAPQWP
jgi:hypothetical protein